MFDPHYLSNEINKIIPDAFEHLEQIASFEQEKASQIVSRILEHCCDATHTTIILIGRNAFKRLPPEWVTTNLPAIIAQSSHLDDDWNYRRLLELLKESNSALSNVYIKKGLGSNNPEIDEAAREFMN